MYKRMAYVVGGFMIVLVIIFICSLSVKKTYTYAEIESILRKASVAYFKDHPEQLPTSEGGIVEIDAENLILAEKMQPLSEYTGGTTTCSGSVKVEKSGSEFLYTPYLNCGDSYETVEFYKTVTKPENVVTTGYGLYNINGTYVFRGEQVNNYVELDEGLWRIVKVTPNNNVVLVRQDTVANTIPWDDRFNPVADYNAGINNYQTSRIKEYLKKLYDNPEEKMGEVILSNSDKARMVSFNQCMGKRGKDEEGNNNSIECASAIPNQKLGLLTVSDYMLASIDPNCKKATSESCQNYNYLKTNYDWWVSTSTKNVSYETYMVNDKGAIVSTYTSSYAYARPVIYLNDKILFKSGNGTETKPYKLK